MTDDLLLRIRLESLNHSFQQMTALAEAMTSSNVSVDRLRGLLLGDKLSHGKPSSDDLAEEDPWDDRAAASPPGEVIALNKQLRSVQDLLRSLFDLLKSNQDVTPHDFVDRRLELTTVSAAKKRLVDLEKTIAAVKDEADALWEELSEWDYLGQRGLEHSAGQDFKSAAKDVDKLLNELRNGGRPEVAWQSYQNLVTTRTRPLFKGFVEMASGLTLRGRRLDERVCAMAEDLAADWEAYYDLSTALTIPALDDGVFAFREDVRASRTVRLGFAGWTVWSLPLFAGTFWRMFADQDYADEMVELAPDDAARQRLRIYFGDSLAVKMMGPAYACSLILLRLDPAQGKEEGLDAGFDVVRAQAVLNALKPKELSPLGEIYRLLDGAWAETLTRVPELPGAPDTEFLEPVGKLTQGFEQAFDRRPGRSALVNASRWDKTAGLAGQPLSEPAPERTRKDYRRSQSALLSEFSVVDVLNAAWRRRLIPGSCVPPAEDPADQAFEARRIAAMVSCYVWPSLQRPSHGAGLARVSGGGR